MKAIMKRLRSGLSLLTGTTLSAQQPTPDEPIPCKDVTISYLGGTARVIVLTPKLVPWSKAEVTIVREVLYMLDAMNVVDNLGFVNRVRLALLPLGVQVLHARFTPRS